MDINRLLDFKKFEPIYVIGHSRPDVDSMVSSVLLSRILNSFGVKSYYCVLDGETFPKQDEWIINDCMIYDPKVIDEKLMAGHKFILVDHNDLIQSIGDSSLVLLAIDHHPSVNQIDNLVIVDYCCTSLYLYDFYKDIYNFSDEEKRMIYMAYLCDCAFEKGSRYNQKDKAIIDGFGFAETPKDLFRKYFIETDFSNGIEAALKLDGYKKYDFDEISFESAYVLRLDMEGIEVYKELIKNYEGNFLGIWNDNDKDMAIAYLKYRDYFKEFKYDYIPSRGSVVIKDALNYIRKGCEIK